MAAPRFSVVIPTYGRPRYLTEAVESVLAQTVEDLECVVVDDASPDPIDVPSDPRVRVVTRRANGGSAAARNSGLDAATGEFVAFLDDDDVFAPDRLELALTGFDHADVSLCWTRWIDGGDRPGRELHGDVRDVILDDLVPHVGATAVRRSVTPRFDERVRCCEDIDWWLRLAHAAPVATTPGYGHLYRRHAGVRHRKTADDRVDARTLILDWHAGYFDAHPAARSFQWKRIGLYAVSAGRYRTARQAFTRSLRARAQPSTAWHLVRSLRPDEAGGQPVPSGA
jgi:glycosyltransferase involved in cell wall biosynthesis